jgi:hypothetical protein
MVSAAVRGRRLWWIHDVAAAGEENDEYGEMTKAAITTPSHERRFPVSAPGAAQAQRGPSTVQEPAINILDNNRNGQKWLLYAMAMSRQMSQKSHGPLSLAVAPDTDHYHSSYLHNETLHNSISYLTSAPKAISQPGFGRVGSAELRGWLLVCRSGLVNAMPTRELSPRR